MSSRSKILSLNRSEWLTNACLAVGESQVGVLHGYEWVGCGDGDVERAGSRCPVTARMRSSEPSPSLLPNPPHTIRH